MGRGQEIDYSNIPKRRGVLERRIESISLYLIKAALSLALKENEGKQGISTNEMREEVQRRGQLLYGLEVNFSGYAYHGHSGTKYSIHSGPITILKRPEGFLLNPRETYNIKRETIGDYDIVSWLDKEPKGRAGIAVFHQGTLVAQTCQEREEPISCYDKSWQPNGGALVFRGMIDEAFEIIEDFRKLHKRNPLAKILSGLDRRRLRLAAKKYINRREKEDK
jgi:hypothetical protein